MAEIKLVTVLLSLMGYSLCGYLLFANFDNFKGWVLLTLGAVFISVRIFFFIKRQYQAVYREQQEARLRELEIKRKYREDKAIELEQLERELSLRITGLTPEQRHRNMRKDNF